MDIGRRNTQKYSSRRPGFMELRKFYDPVFRCFTFSSYQLFPTIDEYAYLLGMLVSDKVPFTGVEGILDSRVIAEAIHLRKSDIDDNLIIKRGIRGLIPKKFIDKDFFLPMLVAWWPLKLFFPYSYMNEAQKFWYSQASLGEWRSKGFARRRSCSPSEHASLGHFLDLAICELGLCSFKVNALSNELECLEKCLAKLTGKFWGMTAAPVQFC
ncbi:hypothetical protein KIW84_023506 [Lathyrus oleraceus]|uniref:DUF7745 domain-containing protein n=1 Tax=Pisum sativum TaxID=3888 RepID=A0A9D4YHM2_PEA|nr:hypothetical protein KIW84_023506 [Pisum sativum]